jgi:hypothetical protein
MRSACRLDFFRGVGVDAADNGEASFRAAEACGEAWVSVSSLAVGCWCSDMIACSVAGCDAMRCVVLYGLFVFTGCRVCQRSSKVVKGLNPPMGYCASLTICSI